MKIEQVVEIAAEVAHEVNRVVCAQLGEEHLEWKDAPEWQKESSREGVRKIQSGEITTPEQSHESWLEHKRADGWAYGPTKRPEAKEHPCMVPYSELPASQRAKDAFYFATVNAVISALSATQLSTP